MRPADELLPPAQLCLEQPRVFIKRQVLQELKLQRLRRIQARTFCEEGTCPSGFIACEKMIQRAARSIGHMDPRLTEGPLVTHIYWGKSSMPHALYAMCP